MKQLSDDELFDLLTLSFNKSLRDTSGNVTTLINVDVLSSVLLELQQRRREEKLLIDLFDEFRKQRESYNEKTAD